MPDPALDALHGDEIRTVLDVNAQLENLRTASKRTITLNTKAALQDPLAYTIDPDNASGNESHFQGITLLADGGHCGVSGSNWKTGCGDVLSFRLNADGISGEAVRAQGLDFPYWHTGGIDCWGDIIIVPGECPRFGADHPGRMAGRAAPPESQVNTSAVFFLRGAELALLPAPIRITRSDILATCAGITRLPNGHFLVMVLAQKESGRVQVDAYISAGPDLRDGFVNQPSWIADVEEARVGHYQSISLLSDQNGILFLIGLMGQKKGHIDVFPLGSGLEAPRQWTRSTRVPFDVGPADFSAGGCVSPIEGVLRVSAVGKFRHVKTKKLTLTQFTVPLVVAAPLTPVG
jgi:hypothetical protein